MGHIGAQTRRTITLERNRSSRIKDEYDHFPNNGGPGIHSMRRISPPRAPTATGSGTQYPNRYTHSNITPAPTFVNAVSGSDIDVLNEILSELQRLENTYMPDINIKGSKIWQLLRRRIRFRVKGKCKLNKILLELSNLNHTLSTQQRVVELPPGLHVIDTYQQSDQEDISNPPSVGIYRQFTHMTPNNASNITASIHHNCNQSGIHPSIASTTYFEVNGDNMNQLGGVL